MYNGPRGQTLDFNLFAVSGTLGLFSDGTIRPSIWACIDLRLRSIRPMQHLGLI